MDGDRSKDVKRKDTSKNPSSLWDEIKARRGGKAIGADTRSESITSLLTDQAEYRSDLTSQSSSEDVLRTLYQSSLEKSKRQKSALPMDIRKPHQLSREPGVPLPFGEAGVVEQPPPPLPPPRELPVTPPGEVSISEGAGSGEIPVTQQEASPNRDTGKGKETEQWPHMHIDEEKYPLNETFMRDGEPNFHQAAVRAYEIVKAREAQRQLDALKGHFQPAPEELRWGIHHTQLEPQVADAVFVFLRKGYPTITSGGLFDSSFQMQRIDIHKSLQLKENTKQILRDLGLTIEEHESKYTSLSYEATTANLKVMKNRWDEIADALPDLGHWAAESESEKARDFRAKYAATALLGVEGGVRHETKEAQKAFPGRRKVAATPELGGEAARVLRARGAASSEIDESNPPSRESAASSYGEPFEMDE